MPATKNAKKAARKPHKPRPGRPTKGNTAKMYLRTSKEQMEQFETLHKSTPTLSALFGNDVAKMVFAVGLRAVSLKPESLFNPELLAMHF